MPVKIRCPNPVCGKAGSVADKHAGESVRCPHCQTMFTAAPAGKAAHAAVKTKLGPQNAAPTLAPSSGETSASKSATASVPGAAPAMPATIGRFTVRAFLGAGACGSVYRAFDPDLEREVALKVPHADRLDQTRLQRFLIEAKATAKLRHAHIVPVYEAGFDGVHHFIASAFIDGRTLADAVDAGPLDFRQAAAIVRDLADALAHAHANGIVHRDVKPGNVMLDAQGQAFLTDFGLAQQQDAKRMTRLGSLLGTPAYMAPEMAKGTTGDCNPACDQYSLGALLYELLCGHAPYSGPAEIVLFNVINTPLPLPSNVNPKVPAALEAICVKALAKQPGERFADCRELAEALRSWLEEEKKESVADRKRKSPNRAEGLQRTASPQTSRLLAGAGVVVFFGLMAVIGLLAWSLRGSGTPNKEEAPQAKTSLPEPLPTPEKETEEFQELLANGQKAMKEKRYADAEMALARAAKLRPENDIAGNLLTLTRLQKRKAEAELKPPENPAIPPPQDGKVIVPVPPSTSKEEAPTPPNTLVNNIGMKFVWIPAGNFVMGSPTKELQRQPDETQHKVTLTKGFYMGVYTVTQEQWQAVMGKNPSGFRGEKNLPVDSVSWDDCQEFIKKLRKMDKKPYRLPTEAEWEYACRAGTKTPFYFGETISTDQANYNGNFTYGDGKKGVYRKKTTPVGAFPANAWGLHDMSGNVWQWCQDWYGDYPANDVVDPQGPEKGEKGVLRGGSWSDYPGGCRSAYRLRNELGPRYNLYLYGLRVCFCLDEDGILAPKKDIPKKEEVAVQPIPFINSIGMKFVWIPPGTFMMGSPTKELQRQPDENQHKVTLTKGFYMGVYTVTQEQWQAVMGKNPSGHRGEKNLPVDSVSWDDCQEFIKKLRKMDKKPYRLPTEAEWEYACRAGTKTPFYFGETISTDQANYNGNVTYGDGNTIPKKGVYRAKPTPVGGFPANAWGLHDMSGNVWQWCQDWHGDYPQSDVVDPQGPENGKQRVLRGGSWNFNPGLCRSASRFWNEPGTRNLSGGLRVCFCLEEDGILAPKKDIPKKEEVAVQPIPFINSIGMKFVWIPPGTFMMGSPTKELLRQPDENQHKVTLTKGFYMGVYTVTQEQWQAVMGKNPSGFRGEKNLPVDSVSWDDCQEFIKKLRKMDKKPYRLPTEAEWEYACRAGTKTPFYFGETISTDQANYNGNFTYSDRSKKGVYRAKTTPVGGFPANAWGLHDMSGNVWQWCQDWHGDYPQSDVVDPQGPENGKQRVLRGGSWHYIPIACRSAYRNWNVPGLRSNHCGLRVCFCLD